MIGPNGLSEQLGWLYRDLVGLVVWAVASLVVIWLGRVVWRERMLRRVSATMPPEQAREMRQAVRRAPLLVNRTPPAPRDPFALTATVLVPPLGDGRPGETFLAPEPALEPSAPGPDDSRQDVRLRLSAGTHLLVVCLGRVGAMVGDEPIEPAAARAARCHARSMPGASALGPVDRVVGRIGEAWRVTFAWPTGRALTDTHVDRDGWAFVVGVLSSQWHARAVAALDAVVATWVWLPGTRATHGWDAGTPGDRT